MPARAVRGALFPLLGLVVLGVLVAGFAGSERAATAAPSSPGVAFVPELGLPATGVVAIGASPAEAPGEAWAYGYLGPVPPAADPTQVNRYALLQHTDAGGWTTVPLPGPPLSSQDGFPRRLGALAGRATPAGGVLLLTDGGIVVRDPGAAPRFVPAPEGEELIGEGESLPPQTPPAGAPTPYAAVDEDGGRTGLVIAPYGAGEGGGPDSLGSGVLHYDGLAWSREPLAAEEYDRVEPLAIDCGPEAGGPGRFSALNCWLLARTWSEGVARLDLFRRGPSAEAGAFEWAAVAVAGGLLGGQPSGGGGGDPEGTTLSPLGAGAQVLTSTAQGAWVDFEAALGGGGPSSATELVAPGAAGATVSGSWCYPTGPDCEASLGAPLPSAYRSFAWPGSGASDPGERIITGLPERTMLRLAAGSFAHVRGAGGSPGSAPGGAAFAAPAAGFLADGVDPHAGRDGGGQSQVFVVSTEPVANQLGTEPVPFRHPLLGVAPEPGTEAGDPDAEAIAVGQEGQLARYVPGEGWRQYPVQKMEGVGVIDLRDVAWPTPDTAYAVGRYAAIREWQRDGDRWIVDISETSAASANFESVAFSTLHPERGFVVGQNQIFRHIDKGWRYSQIPLELLKQGQTQMTSVAYAGDEALASFRVPGPMEGGLILNDGSDSDGFGWEIDRGFEALLGSLPAGVDAAPSEVAGLPDGGAVAAGRGWVAKREGAGAPWTLSAQPLPEATTVTALDVYRDAGGSLRAVVAIAPGPHERFVPNEGFSHDQVSLPASGYLLRETASGWEDMEHQAYGVKVGSADMPLRPEPIYALALSEDGTKGLAVGGQSGNFSGDSPQPAAPAGPPPTPRYETAAALRFPAELVQTPNRKEPLQSAPGFSSFAIGGQAACAGPCANQAATGIGPDAWLAQALSSAAEITSEQPSDLRAFLYTGGRLGATSGDGYAGELERLAELFAGSAAQPLLTAASPDLMQGGPELFASTFAAFGPAEGSSYYAFRSASGGREVLVIVLDYSAGSLDPTQEAWLRAELAGAQADAIPSIVLGSASLTPPLANSPAAGGAEVVQASDAAEVIPIIANGGASAYVYDYPGANVFGVLGAGERRVPAFGSGTLGYAAPVGGATDSLSSGAYLLVELGGEPGVPGEAGVIGIRAIPAIESLTLHSPGGGLVAAGRSDQFEALGRRPAGGVLVEEVEGKPVFGGPEPYVTMPFPSADLRCSGPNCEQELPLDFFFSSSNPEVGYFIARNPEEPRDEDGELLGDPRSGLFCGRQPGETTVTVTAGGLSYSRTVTVTAGDGKNRCLEPPPPEVPAELPVPTPEGPEPAPQEPPPAPQSPGVTQPSPPAFQPNPPLNNPQPPPAPVASQPAPLVQPALPAVAPYPPPGLQPAPPAGLSPASNPVTQPVSQGATQPAAQSSFQPVGQTVTAPGVALSEGEAEEAAIQRVNHAVAVEGHLASARRSAWSGQLLIPALVLLLGAGIGLGAIDARARRRGYEVERL